MQNSIEQKKVFELLWERMQLKGVRMRMYRCCSCHECGIDNGLENEAVVLENAAPFQSQENERSTLTS